MTVWMDILSSHAGPSGFIHTWKQALHFLDLKVSFIRMASQKYLSKRKVERQLLLLSSEEWFTQRGPTPFPSSFSGNRMEHCFPDQQRMRDILASHHHFVAVWHGGPSPVSTGMLLSLVPFRWVSPLALIKTRVRLLKGSKFCHLKICLIGMLVTFKKLQKEAPLL